eukprot:SAG31_NODE_737_length_12474_cov_14.694303_10_plen_158_part_00
MLSPVYGLTLQLQQLSRVQTRPLSVTDHFQFHVFSRGVERSPLHASTVGAGAHEHKFARRPRYTSHHDGADCFPCAHRPCTYVRAMFISSCTHSPRRMLDRQIFGMGWVDCHSIRAGSQPSFPSACRSLQGGRCTVSTVAMCTVHRIRQPLLGQRDE